MRFYVPEWDDNVDANYDFVHDEHSALDPSERELSYIWDIFDYETTPIDGVLISREQVEESSTKANRLTDYGVYEDPVLSIPDWLPTISDCGAWGYKSLPFPPYGNQDMLEFYEKLDVTTGVTIDHLVLGSEHKDRLYLDKRTLGEHVDETTLPDELREDVEVMVEEWPEKWPEFVAEEEPSIYRTGSVEPFEPSVFDGSPSEVIDRLRDDPRAVYREDDMQYRYDLTLKNAEEMKRLYDDGDYTFRLMVAIQGWDPSSYGQAASRVLDLGYDYIGIGGVAGSSTGIVTDIVTEVGNVIKSYEREYELRVDSHVFGFAKTDAFDDVGQTGMTSFDSASMLRAAWTGGENYHLDDERRYDAIRVRFGSSRDDLDEAIEKALRGQELLRSLRAFGANESIADAIEEWHESAQRALDNAREYIVNHRHDEAYDASLIRDVERHFRDDYAHGRELRASFSRKFRSRLVKLLRDDDPESPLEMAEYDELFDEARSVFESTFPRKLEDVRQQETEQGEVATFRQIWPLVEDYAEWVGDEGYLEAYESTLRNEPWRECNCPICEEFGIEVAIFRANNRNRRRGFHNTRRFYDLMERDLPKMLVATPMSASMVGTGRVEDVLAEQREEFWSAVHDLPVAEIGTVSANGFHEWWDTLPGNISLAPSKMADRLAEFCTRYQALYLYSPDGELDSKVRSQIEDTDCVVRVFDSPDELRTSVLDELGYEDEFLPEQLVQTGLTEF